MLFGDAGNDRIIGGADSDIIAGGAGDDRLHDGGGDDIFCFGGTWGTDTVEQRDGGSVTLYFADESVAWSDWLGAFSDGKGNTVTLSGIDRNSVNVIYGINGENYAELTALGAFADSTSGRIFTAVKTGSAPDNGPGFDDDETVVWPKSVTIA